VKIANVCVSAFEELLLRVSAQVWFVWCNERTKLIVIATPMQSLPSLAGTSNL
jgi:hypothetical protein